MIHGEVARRAAGGETLGAANADDVLVFDDYLLGAMPPARAAAMTSARGCAVQILQSRKPSDG